MSSYANVLRTRPYAEPDPRRYFTTSDSLDFPCFRIPRDLILGKRWKNVSLTAKLLYAVLADKMERSKENGWVDSSGDSYVKCTLSELSTNIDRSANTVRHLLNELVRCGLVSRILVDDDTIIAYPKTTTPSI